MQLKKNHQRAWVEIDLSQLRRNFETIQEDKPDNLELLFVVKDQAYGHGAVAVSRVAKKFAEYLAVATMDEAIELRDNEIDDPILVFGERTEEELELCVAYGLTPCINDLAKAKTFEKIALKAGKKNNVHIEIDTGLSRYGIRWNEALDVVHSLVEFKGLNFEGIMSHFAMSDELDKSFALQQLRRFTEILTSLQKDGITFKYRHICNTGGYLDLPQAHFDIVRLGTLPLGVYPSEVCRRIPGIKPIMSVKAKIAATREIQVGDFVGYGMRYQAPSKRRIAVIPLGYGDGYPRVRNKGFVLIGNKRAPFIGGNAMDAMMVDITEIYGTKIGDEVVLLGKQGEEEITVREIANLSNTVTYDIMNSWRSRLPRVYLNSD